MHRCRPNPGRLKKKLLQYRLDGRFTPVVVSTLTKGFNNAFDEAGFDIFSISLTFDKLQHCFIHIMVDVFEHVSLPTDQCKLQRK
jgi:hypothetical protein